MNLLGLITAGLLGLLTGLALEQFRRTNTDRRWLLDRRHEAAVQFLARANALSRAIRRRNERERTERVLACEEAYFGAVITASPATDVLINRVYDALRALGEASTAKDIEAANAVFTEGVGEALSQMNAELRPRRWPRLQLERLVPQRLRRQSAD